MNKREYNSERRRKLNYKGFEKITFQEIRENITPRGDGNFNVVSSKENGKIIRENITPRGDGNFIDDEVEDPNLAYKREYNSERRRKLKNSLEI